MTKAPVASLLFLAVLVLLLHSQSYTSTHLQFTTSQPGVALCPKISEYWKTLLLKLFFLLGLCWDIPLNSDLEKKAPAGQAAAAPNWNTAHRFASHPCRLFGGRLNFWTFAMFWTFGRFRTFRMLWMFGMLGTLWNWSIHRCDAFVTSKKTCMHEQPRIGWGWKDGDEISAFIASRRTPSNRKHCTPFRGGCAPHSPASPASPFLSLPFPFFPCPSIGRMW